ncbi:MAG: hypothetical protein JWP09_817 [Candidatus Taylorbacteria bacterium]|nr:hypothetical protein [Candidatus Taylorbacteria bacterium]
MSKKPTIVTLTAAILIVTSATFTDRVFASTSNPSIQKVEHIKHLAKENGVVGTVESISGNILIIKDKNNVSYNVDVSSAKLFKAKDVTIALSDIKVGEKIFAAGTVTNNTVVATKVYDGQKIKTHSGTKKEFQGVAGVVTSISGHSITLTGKDNIVYVVDATNAAIKKGSATSTVDISQIQSGDKLFVRGVVTGTTVVATNIEDGHRTHVKGSKKVK